MAIDGPEITFQKRHRAAFFIVQIFSWICLMVLTSCTQTVTDRLVALDNFPSDYIKNKDVQVFLPVSYHQSDQSYPVLYMHDGRMLFDSTQTWNGQEWGVDEVIDQLVAGEVIREVIVVASSNGGNELRHPEYFPQKPFEALSKAVQDSLYNLYRDQGTPLFANPVQSDNYLKFIVEELKPFIDKNYRTLKTSSQTFVSGSSMGGLISMYAICEYPEVFGGAACLSTHWPGIFTVENNPVPQAFLNYLGESSPDPSTHKFYFDYGTETLDALYEPYQLEADSILRANGYDSSNFLSLKFPDHKHEERYWRQRLHIPLTFLLSKE